MRRFEDAGLDQVIFLQQGGKNQHGHICASLELFARALLPAFKARHAKREEKKTAELAPYIARALARKRRRAPISEGEIPVIVALGQQRAKQESFDGKTANFGRGGEALVPLEDPLKKPQA
jgi:hypothetical protein